MYGVRDTFERTRSYSAPELTRAMKAKRNAIVFVVILAAIVLGGGWMLITMTPMEIWIPITAILGIVGFIVFMLTVGFPLIGSGFEWIGEQFSTWKEAKEYGVRDE